MSGRSGAAFAVVACGCLLTACGGSGSQPTARHLPPFRVAVIRAHLPAHQRLAQRTRLVIEVLNRGHRTIPDIAVTITNPRWGTAAQAFSVLIPPQPGLASASRPVWIIDRPPGACTFGCPLGGPGGAATAYSNTWALGSLAPGHVARFSWLLTAVAAGRYLVAYRIAASLNPPARAVVPGGRPAAGILAVAITSRPRSTYVANNGRVLYAP